MTEAMPSHHDLADFDQEEIPTGVQRLILQVPENVRPYAEQVGRQHVAMLRIFREMVALLRAIKLMLWMMPIVSTFIATVIGVAWWLYLHIEIHK